MIEAGHLFKTTNLWIPHHLDFLHLGRSLGLLFEDRQLVLFFLCQSLLYFSSLLLSFDCHQKRLYALIGSKSLWRAQASCTLEWASPWALDWPTWWSRSTRFLSHCHPNPTSPKGTHQDNIRTRRMDQKLRGPLCHCRPWVRICQCSRPLIRRRVRSEAKPSQSPSRTQCARWRPLCRTKATSACSSKFEAR